MLGPIMTEIAPGRIEDTASDYWQRLIHHPRRNELDDDELFSVGRELYDRTIWPVVKDSHDGEFVLLDVHTGAYEVDRKEVPALLRLIERVPDAEIWTERVGYECPTGFNGSPPRR